MALIPPLEPVTDSATHPNTGKLCEVWDWVHAKITNRGFNKNPIKSVAIAFRSGKDYPDPLVLLIHEQPRVPRKTPRRWEPGGQKRHISVEWVRLSITDFICKGVLAEFLTHENQHIRNYFNLLAKANTKIITATKEFT